MTLLPYRSGQLGRTFVTIFPCSSDTSIALANYILLPRGRLILGTLQCCVVLPSAARPMLNIISRQTSRLDISLVSQPTSTSRHTGQAFTRLLPLMPAIVMNLPRCLSLHGASHTFVHVRRSGTTERIGGRGVGLFRITIADSSIIVGLAGYFCLCVGPEGAVRGCGAGWECLGFEFFDLVLWRCFDTGFVLWRERGIG